MASSTVKSSNKEKSLDDWLPIMSDRSAKWWYSAFHNVTAMVGAGVFLWVVVARPVLLIVVAALGFLLGLLALWNCLMRSREVERFYASTEFYEYRERSDLPANPPNKCFTWESRQSERHVANFYISDPPQYWDKISCESRKWGQSYFFC